MSLQKLKDDLETIFGSEEAEENGWDPNAFFQEDSSDRPMDGIVAEHVTGYGGEGDGDQYWQIYKFTRGEDSVLVKFDGWYASYVGSEFNEWFFVEPKEVVVTKYFKVE